jgi:hypothetical protein
VAGSSERVTKPSSSIEVMYYLTTLATVVISGGQFMGQRD